MIDWLALKFVRWGLGERFAEIMATLVAAIIITALCGSIWAIWLHSHDRKVIERHEREVGAAVIAATSAAEAAANANDEVRASERAISDAELRRAIDDATASNPEAVRRPAGPAVRAVVDGLRRQ